ncbi:MAG: SoxR reducing system RseC family protein [Clostridia bacterium]|nr:SoxR reducing system RseC family protein [Clostridia bacterium]
MKTKAKVISLDGDFALVETERMSACEGCHKAEEGKGCSVCSLMGASDRKLQAKANNRVGARVGDAVWIESATSRMMLYAVMVFLLPLVMAGVGLLIAFAVTESTLWHAAGAGIGFVLSFLFVFVYSRMVGKTRCDIDIVGVVEKFPESDEKNI